MLLPVPFEDRSGVLLANVCAGFVRPCYGVAGKRPFLGTLGAPRGGLLVYTLMSTGSGLRSCACRRTHPLGGGQRGHYLRGLLGAST